jgi:hypothetical protein
VLARVAAAPQESPPYGCVLDLDPSRYELVVVWGDFLLDRNWLVRACERVAQERGAPFNEVRAHAERVLFGDGGAGPARIVAGQCLLVSDDGYERDTAYQGRFARLAREARVFQMRDPLSVARASVFAGVPAPTIPALDAALLRPALRARLGGAPEAAPARDGFGVFFGRTDGGLRAKLGCALAAASTRGAGPARYLRWLPARPVPGWVRAALRPSEVTLPREIDAIAATLSSLAFVVTDTYHLALVCWSLGVPALCVGAGAQRFQHSVHDKKKEIFFLSQRIERFHVFAEEGLSAARAQARTALAEVADADPGPTVAARIRGQAERVIAVLDAAIGS